MGAPTNMAGAAGGLANFAGAAMSGVSMMSSGLQSGMQTVGQFMDPSMAFEPHHGMIRAESTLGMEWAAYQGGAAAVARATPPGVGAGAYAEALQRNLGRRVESSVAGAVTAGAPMAAGLLAGGAAGWGAKLAGLGGLATFGVGTAAWLAGEAIVGKGIERGNKIFGEVQELGAIATAGRGMTMAQQHEYGRGFVDMSKRMNVSTNELGDIVSGIRASGMMPRTRDVQQSLSQFEGMAKDIRDIAVGMQTSLGQATQYLKQVENLGMGRGSGGVFAASSMADSLGTSLGGLISHVSMGRRMGMQAGIAGGGGLFLNSAMAGASGLGALSGQEQLMVGGAMGLGRAFGVQAMQNATGPWGQMQMMAMMGPTGAQGLPGGALATMQQAAGNMLGGGDPISNMVEFSTNQKRMLGQIGPRGMQQMQAHAIQSQADMLMQLSPGITQNRALQFVGMQQGLGEHQARAMSAYIMRGMRPAGPSGAAQGMPSMFAGGTGAMGAMMAEQDTAAREANRQIREDMKMPWTRAIEGIGDWWSQQRQNLAESSQAHVADRMARMGVFKPSEAAMETISSAMRRGTDIGRIDIGHYGPAGGQMQSVLGFAGQTGAASGAFTIGSARAGIQKVARNIHKSTRLNASEEAEQNEVLLKIGEKMGHDSHKYDQVAGRIRANVTKLTKGGGDAIEVAGWLKSDIGQIFRGTGDYEKEFKNLGFSGEHGAQMMNIVNRVMRGRGEKDFSIQDKLQQFATTGMGAAAYALDVRAAETVSELLGLGSIEPTDEEVMESAQATRAVRAAKLEGMGGAGRSMQMLAAHGPAPTKEDLEQERASIRQKRMSTIGETRKKGMAVVASKSFREYMKLRDTMFHKPYRDARAIVRRQPGFKKMTAEEKAKRVREEGNKLKDKATKKDMENLITAERRVVISANIDKRGQVASDLVKKLKQDEGLAKKLKQDTGIINAGTETTKKKRSSRRRRRGRTVAFQGQAESFQSQVAVALRKTTHVLNDMIKRLPPPPKVP